jgi:site-specific recombinase XerD
VPAAELTPDETKHRPEDTQRGFVYSPSRGPIEPAAIASATSPAATPLRLTAIETATPAYLEDCKARELKSTTIYRHEIIFRQLKAFAKEEKLTLIRELDTAALGRFRKSWKGESGLAKLKKLERLRSFFNFCVANGYCVSNPADKKKLKNPKVRHTPTMPLSQEQMLALLTAAEKRIDQRIAEARPDRRNHARRLKALVLFLRYSGLRISDAVGCACDRVQKGKLFLYTAKTGEHVNVPLPPFVIEELERVPKKSAGHWFWNATGTLETARKDWTEALDSFFEAASISDGHAHRFRDTFAVEHLLAGTPIERVLKLLGHSGVRITELHYNPWNRAAGAGGSRCPSLVGGRPGRADVWHKRGRERR